MNISGGKIMENNKEVGKPMTKEEFKAFIEAKKAASKAERNFRGPRHSERMTERRDQRRQAFMNRRNKQQ